MQRNKTITDRIDTVTGIGDKYRGTVLPAPRSVKIELTANCNYKCSFCVKSIREDSRAMNRDFYSRVIREMRDAGVEELGVFYIGESFTCKWLPDAILEAKQVGYPYVFLTTNGSAVTENRLRQCFDAGLDSLKFSINFSDEGQFQEVAQVNPRFFRKAIEMVKVARKMRDEGEYDCGIFASSIKFDGEQGRRMQEVVDEILPYVDEHYWLPLYGMSGAGENNIVRWKPKPGNPGRLDNLREPLPCWTLFSEGHIVADGHLSACCFGSGIEDGSLLMGDLNKMGFMQAWNSPEFQAIRAAHLAKDVTGTGCESCVAGG